MKRSLTKTRLEKPRGEAGADAATTDDGAKSLSAPQLIQATAAKEFIEKQIKQREDIKSNLTPDGEGDDLAWVKHIPSWAMQKLSSSVCEATAQLSLLEVMIENQKVTGLFKTGEEELTKLKASWKDTASRCKLQVDEAKKVEI